MHMLLTNLALNGKNFHNVKLSMVQDYASTLDGNYIGCKDDGANDLFGPLCVVSCLIESSDLPWLQELGIELDGSYSETKLIDIAREIKDKLIYSLLILDNSHYNAMAKEGSNLASIRSKLSNQAITNVMQKVNNKPHTKVAQAFVSPKTYFNYLKNEVIVVKDISFIEKEEQHIAISCCEILAKYACLQYFANMSKSLKIQIPRGTGIGVEQTAIKLIDTYDKDLLLKVAKTNLPSYKKIIDKI